MRTLAALLFATLLLASAGPAGVATGDVDARQADAPNACVGTVTEQPDTPTVVSIQGSRLTDDGYTKTHALLLSYAPDGSVEWIRNATANGRWWAYDVDPLPDGTLLFASTEPGYSVVGELSPDAARYEWVVRFDGDPGDESTPLVTDAHDADLLSEHELVLVDKGEGHERLLVYNLTRDAVQWEWRFDEHPEHFPESGGGPADDWTHVNDVDLVNVSESEAVDAEGEWFMASVRNFDQVVFIDRRTGEVTLTLGEDGAHDILHRQHNPDHLWGPNGEHTVLVADSLNDRVVEYAYDDTAGEWDLVWQVTGLDEPRDADRLANGNTLVADRKGHRVVEVTPAGEIVWEVYTPFEPYDVERGPPGSSGPTMRDVGAAGSVEARGGAPFSTGDIEACAGFLYSLASDGDRGVHPPGDGDGSAGTGALSRVSDVLFERRVGGLPLWVLGVAIAIVLAVAFVGLRRRSG